MPVVTVRLSRPLYARMVEAKWDQRISLNQLAIRAIEFEIQRIEDDGNDIPGVFAINEESSS